MTYKIGTIGEFMAWTKRIITVSGAVDETPKHWFDNDATAARALDQSIKSPGFSRVTTPKKPTS